MNRLYNFCAGPAALPEAVLLQAQNELLDWQQKGLSVMEMSHRSSEFVGIAEAAEADLRDIMGVSDDYAILFLQGGASQQFSVMPLNLLNGKSRANYVNTGQWSKKAIKEAGRYCDVNVVASSEADNFSSIPAFDSWNIDKDAAYLHYTPNETIGGVEFFGRQKYQCLWLPICLPRYCRDLLRSTSLALFMPAPKKISVHLA